MGDFMRCRDVEKAGLELILPYLKRKAFDGQVAVCSKGELSAMLQRESCDLIWNPTPDKAVLGELKVEEEDHYGNFFLEAWSNLTFGMQKAGWMYTAKCDLLLYLFLNDKRLYVVDFPKLFAWAHVPDAGGKVKLDQYPLRRQKKNDQLNKTFGRCVPIAVVRREVGFVREMAYENGDWFAVGAL